MSPLALMICPHGSSPHHSLAARIGAGRLFGASKALFRWFDITSSAPSMLIASAAKNSPSNSSSFVQGGDRPTVVLARPSSSAREDDARDLVGERHRGQIELVCDGLALEHPARP